MPSSDPFLTTLSSRRSYYALHADSPIPDSKIRSIIAQVLQRTPSAFNSQTTRIVVLLKSEHEKFWDVVKRVLLEKIGEDNFARTECKIHKFFSAYGTVLFYEDTPTIDRFKEVFPNYAEHFDAWSEHTSGMHQILVWLALETEGFGANLQHYNPVIDERVAGVFGIPDSWRLRAQLVFGMRDAVEAPVKEKRDVNDTLWVLGDD